MLREGTRFEGGQMGGKAALVELALGFGLPLLVACGGGSGAGGGALSPAEVFRFSREPISFSPPPERWTRDTPGLPQGLTGLRFALDRGVAAEIVVGEYQAPGLVAARDCLRALIPRYAQLSPGKGEDAIYQCRSFRDALNAQEESLRGEYVDRLREAEVAHSRGDGPAVEAALNSALAVADQAAFSVEEVAVAPYKFAPERYEESYRFEDVVEERVEVGGIPALRMSYRVKGSGGSYRHGRWVYLLSPNHHLFALHYLGREGPPMETFDRVVASISFPPAS